MTVYDIKYDRIWYNIWYAQYAPKQPYLSLISLLFHHLYPPFPLSYFSPTRSLLPHSFTLCHPLCFYFCISLSLSHFLFYLTHTVSLTVERSSQMLFRSEVFRRHSSDMIVRRLIIFLPNNTQKATYHIDVWLREVECSIYQEHVENIQLRLI